MCDVVDQEFLSRWCARLADETPDVVAVLLKGSHARGVPGPYSDIDFDVIVTGGRADEYPAWLDTVDGQLVLVSAAVRDVGAWLAEERQSQPWALGFPSAEVTRLLWARDDTWRRQVERAYLAHPAGPPELEDFIAGLGKMANARRDGDGLALRAAAQNLATLCPGVLRPLNEPVCVGTAYEALTTALALTVVPPGYRDDLLVCLGLSGHATSLDDVYRAGRRLVGGTAALCAAHPDRFAGLVPDSLAGHLADGTLASYLTQFGG